MECVFSLKYLELIFGNWRRGFNTDNQSESFNPLKDTAFGRWAEQ